MNMMVAILSISGLPQIFDLSRLTEFAACLTVLIRIVCGQCGRVLLLEAIACLKLALEQNTVRVIV